ncbi:hypothetical protein SAMN04488030_0249 [Aliiroseovarius halocynthiae]|uniref:CTP synthetase n=1 Tax=Aliiroseovarius halocynthiae TaxID=985055 RepID=A0A545SYD4_9RHOB|nr:CTP synthetase [Aliiroseovarius halocynthiae]TQV69973.1 CTP synthetase [Aliiroseovarius halocynthiae]SMR70637.1 hypothetical protein SAMN04488030_0249 [Aliiroseovarius halocynthiae]
MLRLASVIYILLGATLAGIFIVAALTVGLDTAQPITYAAISGFIVAIPISWFVAKQING